MLLTKLEVVKLLDLCQYFNHLKSVVFSARLISLRAVTSGSGSFWDKVR